MKTKLKSGNAIVRLLLLHGEKLLIGLLVACAGLLVYGSLGRERLPENNQPDDLVTLANSADSHVRSLRWENFDQEERIDPADLSPPASTINIVPRDAFPNLAQSINPPVVEPVSQRTDPLLLTALDLEVHSGSGLWASANPEVIRQKMLEAIRQQRLAEQERLREQERMENDPEAAQRGFGGEGGGYGRGPGFGGEGGYGGMGAFGGQQTASGAIVVSPTSGAPVQGFEDIQSRSWVTVLARIPIKNQHTMYEDALKNSRGYDPNRDLPQYRGYQVERAEVTAEGTGDWQVIANVNDKRLISVMETWPVQTPEIANPKFVHPLLTYPLPPMVLRTWDKDVTHSSMPLPDPSTMYGMSPEEEEALQPKPEEEAPADSDDPFAQRRERNPMGMGGYGRGFEGGGEMGLRGPMGGRGYGGPGAMGRGMEGGYGRPGMEGGYGRPGMGSGAFGGEGGYGRGGGMGMGMGMGTMMGGAGSVTLPPYAWDGRTKELLFRYFDASVQPGKSYRYRVRLVLTDVNDGVPEGNLEKTVQERVKAEKDKRGKETSLYRFTDWSEQSPVASVPQIGLLFVAGAKAANESNFASEPEAEILIKTLDAKYAAQVGIAEWFKRGSVLNVIDHAKVIWASRFEPEDQQDPEFTFRTGVTLLDFDGGDPLNNSRDLAAPTRALLMDAAGRLTLQDELDNAKQVDEYKQIVKMAEEAKRRQSEGFGGPGGEGGRGGGGYGRGPGGF